jgi:hypothetical protein
MKAVFYPVKTPKDGSWANEGVWTEPALEDLEAIQAYIAKDSNFYARCVIERIFDAAKANRLNVTVKDTLCGRQRPS